MKLEWKMSLGHKNADRNEKMLRLGRNKKVLTDKVLVDKVLVDKVLMDKVRCLNNAFRVVLTRYVRIWKAKFFKQIGKILRVLCTNRASVWTFI